MKKEVIELIQKEKIIAIVRGVDAEHILPTAEALYKGGPPQSPPPAKTP